jgi:hypothetical protein
LLFATKQPAPPGAPALDHLFQVLSSGTKVKLRSAIPWVLGAISYIINVSRHPYVCLRIRELLVVDELADKDNKDQLAMLVTWASPFVPSSAVESQHHFHLCVRRYTNDIVSEVRKPHRIQTSWVFNTENVTRGSVLILVQPLHSTRFWMPELIFPVPTQSLDTPRAIKTPCCATIFLHTVIVLVHYINQSVALCPRRRQFSAPHNLDKKHITASKLLSFPIAERIAIEHPPLP